MCGISGIFGYSKSKVEILDKFLITNNHRGPDSLGKYSDDSISMGVNRLSIIDIDGGNQPFESSNGNLKLIFNGEIYNYKEIKKTLTDKYNFYTNSDTEVILRGFEEYGKTIFEKLNGIFSVAIWDTKKQVLILARDPLGVKPLYYGIKENNFYFSSELKTFTENNIFNEGSLGSVNQFLSSGYIFCPNSALENVKQLNPGDIFTINKHLKIDIINIRNISFERERLSKIDDLEEYVFSNLKKAVERQSISDVPIGLLLSSGIDSMSILASIKEIGNIENLKTFTAYYPNENYSENRPVEYLAKEWGFKNTSVLLTPDLVFDNLDNIFHTFDNLDFIPVCMPKYIVSKLASSEMKVLYAGAGGDEIFLSYPTHIASAYNKKYNFNHNIFKFLRKFLVQTKDYNTHLHFYEKLERFITGASYDKDLSHLFWRYIYTFEEIQQFISFNEMPILQKDIYEEQIKIYNKKLDQCENFCDVMSAFDIETWLLDHALKLWDKAGMASSVEIRVPFLDIEFLNNMFLLPTDKRTKPIGSKQILRNSLRKYIPDEIISLPKKGFTVPVGDWLHNKKINNRFKELSHSISPNLIDKNYLEKMWNNFDNKKGNFAYRLWITGCLAGWIDKHKISFN